MPEDGRVRRPASRSLTLLCAALLADVRMTVQPGLRSCGLIDVIRPPARRAALVFVAAASFAVAGCGVAGPESRTFVGPVTVVSRDSICVGGPDASGEGFGKNPVTRNLHVSDCVRVTYTPDDSTTRSTATRIERLDAAINAADCPPQ